MTDPQGQLARRVEKYGAAMPARSPGAGAGMALSIDVEDWFHSANVTSVVPRETWDRCASRVESNTMRMLEILHEQRACATFFVLGWVAERFPRLVLAIAAAGHEIASHGYGHELVYRMTPPAFRADVARARVLLEDLTSLPVRGYRAPCFSITDWATDILQEEGYSYDSSAVTTLVHDRYGRLAGINGRQPILKLRERFDEVCVSCLPLGSRGVPWGGGGYFRFVPYALWTYGIAAIRWAGLPYVFYIHPWEIDPEHPLPAGISASNRFRQRVNLHRCEARFAALAGAFEWISIGDLLDRWHAQQRSAATPDRETPERPPASRHGA
jgi:polysaccharide deacetylase family protein (PEP-CTERM system associated)